MLIRSWSLNGVSSLLVQVFDAKGNDVSVEMLKPLTVHGVGSLREVIIFLASLDREKYFFTVDGTI